MATYEKHLEEIVTEALRPLDDSDTRWKPVGRAKTQAELTWGELDLNRRESRRLFLCNEYAIGGTQCRVNYVCGQGFQYRFASRFDSVPVDPAILKLANDWLEEFDETNDLFALETEALMRYDRDGELFLRLFSSEIPEVRFVEPERVIGPEATTDTYRDQLGIRHDLHDWQTVLGYHIRPEAASENSEYVEADEVIQIKGNCDSSCLRGQPTYQPVFENLRRCEDLLSSMTSMAKARAKIALIMQIENFNRQKAEDVVGKLTQSTQENADGTRTQVTIEQLPIGSIMRIPATTNVQFPNSSVGSSDYVAVLQADLRAIASSVNMPEWMFTGLADQKYSNAFVVEAPTLRAFTRLQKVFTTAFGSGRLGRRASLVWRAAQMAAQYGAFPNNVLELLKVECTGPALEVRDKASEASVNAQYVDRGIKSKAQVQREIGLDPTQMAEEVEKEQPKEEQPAGQNPFDLPSFESLELVDVDGEWYTTDAAEWVLEGRDRSHLVKKTITNKAGRKQTVWVNPNKVVAVPKTQIEKQLEKDERYSKTATAVDEVIQGKAAADGIVDKLKGVRLIDLFKLKKQFGLKNSGKLKQDLIDSIAKEIGNKASQATADRIKASRYKFEESPKARFKADTVMQTRINSFLKEAEQLETVKDYDYLNAKSQTNALRAEIEQGEKALIKMKGSAKLKESQRINELRKKAIESAEKAKEIQTALQQKLPKLRSMVVDIVKDRVDIPTKFEYLASPVLDNDLNKYSYFYSDSAPAERVAKFKAQVDFVSQVTSRGDIKFAVMQESTIGDPGRAHAITPEGAKSGIIYLPVSESRETSFIHELGHIVENANPKIKERTKRFLDERVGNEEPVALKDKFGSKYSYNEVGRKDQFDKVFTEEEAYYIGKSYSSGSTEVISMGLQKLWENPADFARKDPELFHFLLNTLAEANN